MIAVIKQNGQVRMCNLVLGQKVKHPEGFWGTIRMFGEDDKQQPRVLMTYDSVDISVKRGAYPDELQLVEEDFLSGEIIFNQH